MTQIPSPVVVPSAPSQRRPGAIEQLLVMLAGTAGQIGLQQLLGPDAPVDPQVIQQQAEQQQATRSLLGEPGSIESAQLPGAAASGLGDASVPTGDVAGISTIQQASPTAPARLASAREQQAIRESMEILGRVPSIEVDGQTVNVSDQLLSSFALSQSLKASGVDSSIISQILNSTLPPDQQELLAHEESILRIREAQTDEAADTFATEALIARGVLPEGAPPFPGAAQTVLAMREAELDREIDWEQEGLDFITGRIGVSIAGANITFAGDPEPIITPDQALAEWLGIVRLFAPVDKREELISFFEGNEYRIKIEEARAVGEFAEALAEGMDEAVLRETFKAAFTPLKLNDLLKKARNRNNPAFQR